MNKKLIYVFAVLVAGLFVVSACEQAVGRRVLQPKEKNGGGIEDFVTLDLRVNPEGSGSFYFISPYGSYETVYNRTVYRYSNVPSPNGSIYTLRELYAYPNRNYTFDRWTGMLDDLRINVTWGGIDSIPLNRNRIITANFRRR